jgi:hypothetical protein
MLKVGCFGFSREYARNVMAYPVWFGYRTVPESRMRSHSKTANVVVRGCPVGPFEVVHVFGAAMRERTELTRCSFLSMEDD